MKKFTLPLLILASLSASAQVTLTQAVHGITPGSSSNTYEADTASYTPGGSGTLQTWDFSGLTYTGDFYGTGYVNTSTTPFSSSYPGATVSSDDGSGGYSYYTLTATDFASNGDANSSYAMVFTNPETVLKFPFSYGSNNTDNFAGGFTGTTVNGTMNINADASGTLILPSGSYTTLRVKSTESYTMVTGPASITVHVTNYSWYTATDRFPILQYIISTMSGASSEYDKSIFVSSAVVGINELGKNDNFLSAYPNPAHNSCTVSYTLKETANVSMTLSNILGENVMNISQGNRAAGAQTETIDLSTLPKGIYIVRLIYGNHIACKKITVD